VIFAIVITIGAAQPASRSQRAGGHGHSSAPGVLSSGLGLLPAARLTR
jgi:hypothetical protein